MQKIKNQFRQGDVLVQRLKIRKLPAGFKPVPREGGRVILAHGEVTGHAHALADPEVTLYVDEKGNMIAEVEGDKATIDHEDHGTLTPTKGYWKVDRQTEYTPERLVNVAD
tara:strand:+ start:637 stop:969 length:333 start_codon:yes stop_codon:yes gene_type:complete